jgi:hypothetical protein
MPDFSDIVPLPSQMNQGLSACRADLMLEKFGKPGPLTRTCSHPDGAITARIKYGVNVGPFKVSGLDYAVESLTQVFSQIASDQPAIHAAIKTAGMLCVRSIRNSPSHYSNHSWGTAIDLYFGTGVLPQGNPHTQRGFLDIYQIFNQNGWYWGAGFSGMSVDSMHFELANETIAKMGAAPLAPAMLVAAKAYISETGYDVIGDKA